MAKKKKKKAEETVEEPKAAKKEPGPKLWHCPHCDTFYRADMKTAQENHLTRHANK